MIAGGNGGRVLHLSSVRGQLGIDNGFSAYVAAKGALDALTRQQATEWAKHDITVNAISPTFVRTPQVEDLLADDAFREGLYKRIPLGRIAETDDVVGAVLLLAQRRVGVHHRPGAHARRRAHRVPVTEAPFIRSNLREQIKDVILQRILDGEYPPGAPLVETRIAQELGVSQAPVREALRDLEQLGCIVHEPFRGCSVRAFSADELLEAFPVRAALEALAARLAADRITEPELLQLAELLETMRAAARRGDAHGQSQANASFHATIVRAARNATLERQWSFLEPFSRTYISVSQPGLNLLRAVRAPRPDPRGAARARRRRRRRRHAPTPDGRRRPAAADGGRRSSLETHRRPLDAGARRHAHVPARAAAGAVRVREPHRVRRADRRRRVRRRLAHRQLPRRAVNDHVGTHCDARKHIVPTAGGPDTIPLEYCMSDGVLLDFTDREPGDIISAADIEAALEKIDYTVKERDIVLIHTGAGAYNTEERYRTDHPGMSAEATRWLIERGVRLMGCDAITFDPPVWAMFEKKKFWEAHRVMWDEEYWHLENLMNLDQIGRPHGFQLCVLPVKWVGHDGRAGARGGDRGGLMLRRSATRRAARSRARAARAPRSRA